MFEEVKCEFALKAYRLLTILPIPYIFFKALRDKLVSVLDSCFPDYWVDQL